MDRKNERVHIRDKEMRLFRCGGHICQMATQTWRCASFSSYCSSTTWQSMSWTIWKNAFKITMENSKCVKCIFFQPSSTTNFTSTECPGFSINHKYFYNAKTSVLSFGKLLCAISTLFCTSGGILSVWTGFGELLAPTISREQTGLLRFWSGCWEPCHIKILPASGLHNVWFSCWDLADHNQLHLTLIRKWTYNMVLHGIILFLLPAKEMWKRLKMSDLCGRPGQKTDTTRITGFLLYCSRF